MHKTLGDLQRTNLLLCCWSDSQVVLAWLRCRPNSWKTFVANRVSEILTTLPTARWRHVKSALNPADLATRGMTPDQLAQSSLWWHGPFFIREAEESSEPPHFTTSEEQRGEVIAFQVSPTNTIKELITRFSTLRRLVRVIAILRRWKTPKPEVKATKRLRQARLCLLCAAQMVHYSKERDALAAQQRLPRSSNIRNLSPFLDQDDILRVGGRLQYSFLSYSEKHPVIVSKNSHMAELFIRDAHQSTLHGGPQLMQSHLVRRVWIPQVRSRLRALYRSCLRCCRFRGHTLQQQMAPLPATRLTPTRPFHTTGLDYAGPFMLRTSKGRGQRAFKGYGAIFTCFVTRATHIEVVSDYTAKTCLLAFQRFVSRRGLCFQIHSDNGTTFQGADAELRRLFQAASSFSQDIKEAFQADGVQWTFIPPRAPHFGGLWESMVKSFKHHLRRVVGDAKPTFEEFSTLTATIEACLNSRPLSPLSSDSSDIAALTPGHFLIGAALTSPPEPPSSGLDPTGVPRWRLVTQMRQHFWRRWHKEVLHQFQKRAKWLDVGEALRVGDLVLLTDGLMPTLKWPLARVESLHPGPDGLARVATIRTTSTTLQRPITRLIRLPINEAATTRLRALGE